jgi:membrane peptidoglycan carboxypeptidase
MSLSTENNCLGYVLYSTEGALDLPFAIVSGDEERKAACTVIPKTIQDFLIEVEDKRFLLHFGIDLKALVRAAIFNLKVKQILQGGSTITQQLARNLLRNNAKTLSRKIQESALAITLESRYKKFEILNLYFSEVYFGKQLYGLRSAALHYFGKEPEALDLSQQLALITILRGPNLYSNHYKLFSDRFALLNNLLCNRGRIPKPLESSFNPSIKYHLAVVKPNVIPHITREIVEHKKIIFSTLNFFIQTTIERFVAESPYPLSIVGLSKVGVFAAHSSYGMDYVFNHRGNVGSTLKPFLYCYLRRMGIEANEVFDSRRNTLNWNVREVKKMSSKISLRHGLYHSNNNAFINACSKVGLDKSLHYLATILNLNEKTPLFPSAILGSISQGLSLFDLASAYHRFFHETKDTHAIETLKILRNIAHDKLGSPVTDIFLKTGTTNHNDKRIAVIGVHDAVYVLARSSNPIDDHTKEGNFLSSLRHFINKIKSPPTDYKWS